MNDAEKLKSEQCALWNENAAGWNKWWPVLERAAQKVSDRLVELARVAPGARVLDIATGNGEPAATAARRAGPGGKVTAVDQSSEMLAIARQRAAALKLANLEFIESDAESLMLPASSFDAALCRWGLMFMPDLTSTLRVIHRLLKPGKWFATAVWNSGDKVPMITLAAEAIREITGSKSSGFGGLDPTRLADTSILTSALNDAGFKSIAIEPIMVGFEFASVAEFLAFRTEVGRAQAMMARLEPEARERVRDAIVQAAGKFVLQSGGLRLDSETICFSAQA